MLLGKYGSAASRQEYLRVIAEWTANRHRVAVASQNDLTINELMLEHAAAHV